MVVFGRRISVFCSMAPVHITNGISSSSLFPFFLLSSEWGDVIDVGSMERNDKQRETETELHTFVSIRQLHNSTIQFPAAEICSVAFAVIAHFWRPMSRARVDGAIVLDATGQYIDCTTRRLVF